MTGGNSVVRCKTRMIVVFLMAAGSPWLARGAALLGCGGNGAGGVSPP